MSLDQMIADAYGHFLNHYNGPEISAPIFHRYAIEELNLSETAALVYTRPTEIEIEDEIASDKFDRFYTWYYINYMINQQHSTILN